VFFALLDSFQASILNIFYFCELRSILLSLRTCWSLVYSIYVNGNSCHRSEAVCDLMFWSKGCVRDFVILFFCVVRGQMAEASITWKPLSCLAKNFGNIYLALIHPCIANLFTCYFPARPIYFQQVDLQF